LDGERKKRVLLTGGSGFVGGHAVSPLMEAGYEVHALINRNLPRKTEGIYLHRCDLADFRRQKELTREIRATHLLHFAWYAEHGKYWASPENYTCVEAGAELVSNFAESGGRRAVFAGTCAEYDWSYGYCSEGTTPLRPSTVYGSCKNRMRMMLEDFSAKAGLKSSWGRIFFLYGPGEDRRRLVPTVALALLRREPASLCTRGDQVRDFLYVGDAARAFVALLDSGVEGAVNIASGAPVSVRDVVRRIAERTGRRDLVRFGAIQGPDNGPPSLTASVSRLADEVGWRPSVDLDTGIDLTLAALTGGGGYGDS